MRKKFLFGFYTLVSISFVSSHNASSDWSITEDVLAENQFPLFDEEDPAPMKSTSSPSKLEQTVKSDKQRKSQKERKSELERMRRPQVNFCETSMRNSGTYGIIMSPRYPDNYGNDISCLWSIRAPQDHVILISFRSFQLEEGVKIASSCPFDFLYIFEEFLVETSVKSGLYQSKSSVRYRQNIGTYCGSSAPGTIRSKKPGSTIYFYFRSDGSKTAKGFLLTYQYEKAVDDAPLFISTPSLLSNDGTTEYSPSLEEEFLKIFSVVVFVFVFFTVCMGTLYRCWKSTNQQLAAEGRVEHTCCCGRVRLNVVAGSPQSTISRVRLNQQTSPRLPTPPPEYGDIVKTEEDWNRVLQRLGEASSTALLSRRAAEELRVTYDLSDVEITPNSSTTLTAYTETTQSTSREGGSLEELPANAEATAPPVSTMPTLTTVSFIREDNDELETASGAERLKKNNDESGDVGVHQREN